MRIGYARVSTDDQYIDLQRDALNKARCERIFEDVVSGVKSVRTGLSAMLANPRRDDTVIIWRLDRLGRSLKEKRLDPAKREVALQFYHERRHTILEICRMMGVGRSTLYNYLTEAERDARQSA